MSPIRVVVVDDDPVVRAVVAETFAALDDVELVGEARTAVEAVGLVREAQPDVVVLDHHMPGGLYQRTAMHGIEGVEYLKSLPSPPRIVVYSATAGLAAAATGAGADAFVEKSDDCSELVDVVRALGASR